MAAPVYQAWNGNIANLGSGAMTLQPTGTALRTMLQIKPGTPKIRIIEWGYSFDVVPTAAVKVELITVGANFATMTTALASGDIVQLNDVTGAASQAVTGSTTGSAFSTTSVTENAGSSGHRLLGYRSEWGQSFVQQFPLGREPEVNGGTSLRIRVTTATTINMACYVIWEE